VKNTFHRRALPASGQALDPLRDLSARIGNDPLLIQAANGNTSIKLDGVLWIKASGKWLARATRERMFVPLDLAEIRDRVRAGMEIGTNFPDDLRPSIETAMHAVLPHRVVIHVHSVNAIAWAVRVDGPSQLKERLTGLRWRWIPYAASGLPLAGEIAKATADEPKTDVFILGNHGLVVCGEDCAAAEGLLRRVERRLRIVPRRFPKPDITVLSMISRFPRWRFPDVELLHALGTDAVSRKILKTGVLYPCQAIFLGTAIPIWPPAAALAGVAKSTREGAKTPRFVAVERCGVLVDEGMTGAERATLLGLAQVTLRTEESALLRYLHRAEVLSVLTGPSYGQQPAAANGSAFTSS